MKKMDEIMELLTEEIDGFNSSIDRLQKLKDSLNHFQVKADTTHIEKVLTYYLKEQERKQDTLERMIRDLHKSMASNYYLPNSFAITFLVILYFTLFAMGYLVLGTQ